MSVVPRAARPLLNGVASVSGRRCASHGSHGRTVIKYTMNDLPSPAGSWAEAQKKRDMQYNLHLLLGIVTLTGTIAYIVNDDTLFFNWAPPDLPEEQFGKRPKRPWLGIFKD